MIPPTSQTYSNAIYLGDGHGLVTCDACGSAVWISANTSRDGVMIHNEWHAAQAGEQS